MFNFVVVLGLITLAVYSIVDRICKSNETCALYNSFGIYLRNMSGNINNLSKDIMGELNKIKED